MNSHEERVARIVQSAIVESTDGDWEGAADRAAALIISALSEEKGGWLPIESAPRDGTEVLIFEPGRDDILETGHWDSDRGRWLVNNNAFWVVEPTHWQPLPAAPSVGGGEEKGSASQQPTASNHAGSLPANDRFLATLRHAVADYSRSLTTAEVLATLAACTREVEEDA